MSDYNKEYIGLKNEDMTSSVYSLAPMLHTLQLALDQTKVLVRTLSPNLELREESMSQSHLLL